MRLAIVLPMMLLALPVPTAIAQGSCSWSSLDAGLTGVTGSNSVRDMVVFDDGTGPALYAGGRFSMAGGTSANNIAKWDGVAWSPLAGGVSGVGQNVLALAVFDDGTGTGPALFAGGSFLQAGGVAVNHIAKWDGTSWSALGSGIGGSGIALGPRVHALAVYDDGTGGGPALFVGGRFSTAGGISASSIAKWDGVAWTPLGPAGSGVTSNSAGVVYAMEVFDGFTGTGPTLHVGGSFTSAGGVAASNIASWDGTAWWPLAGGVALGYVTDQVVFDAGTGPELFVGGTFGVISGPPFTVASHIARWNGLSWATLGTGVVIPNAVGALTVFDDGAGPALYAGGGFFQPSGLLVGGVLKWLGGSSWTPLSAGSGVGSLAIFDDGNGADLYAGGSFTTMGGVLSNGIARWSCGAALSVFATQTQPGAPVFIHNTPLNPGNEYFNLFSTDLCPGGPGSGPASTFGACLFTPGNVASVVGQLMSPVGTVPFHVIAPSSYVIWGPFNVVPVTVDAICIDVTGGVIGPVSPVVRIVVQ